MSLLQVDSLLEINIHSNIRLNFFQLMKPTIDSELKKKENLQQNQFS